MERKIILALFLAFLAGFAQAKSLGESDALELEEDHDELANKLLAGAVARELAGQDDDDDLLELTDTDFDELNDEDLAELERLRRRSPKAWGWVRRTWRKAKRVVRTYGPALAQAYLNSRGRGRGRGRK